MKQMSTIKFPNQTETYEIVDATARLLIENKSNTEHTHTKSEITDFAHEHDERYYSESEIDEKIDFVNTLITNITNGTTMVGHAFIADSATRATTSDVATTATTADYATSATKATQDENGKVISSTYETKEDAETKLAESKEYTDIAIADLINGAPTTLDTLGEVATAMEQNADIVEALHSTIGTKVNQEDFNNHINNLENPHAVTAEQLNLGNVENKSSSDIRSEITSTNVTDALGFVPANDDHLHDGLIKTPSIDKAYITGTTSEIENANAEVFNTGAYVKDDGVLHVSSIEVGNETNYCTFTFDDELRATVISFS